MEETEKKIVRAQGGKRVFKLINNELIIGDVETVPLENHVEILIKQPYTAKDGNLMPYMITELTSAPAAIQIHPMNIIWTVPLDEFPEAEKVYRKATTGLDIDTAPRIIY